MKSIIRKLAAVLLPLLIPVLENLVHSAMEEIKKKLKDQLISESLTIQKQLRSISDASPNS